MRRPLAGLFVTIAILLISEGLLRLAGVRPAYKPELLPQWRMTANLDQKSLQGPTAGHAFHVSTNADGLRTRLSREKSRRRVALLGDSVVFGWGVEEGETFPDAVAAALPDIDILNAGQPGYSCTMAAWLYGQVVKSYQPDLVILFFSQNDYGKVLVSDREVLQGGATPWASTRVFLAQESRIYEVLRGLLFRNTAEALVRGPEESGEPRVSRASEADLRLALAETGARLGLLPVERPAPEERAAWKENPSVDPSVLRIDLRDCAPDLELAQADDPHHFSALGNQAVGRCLANEIAAFFAEPSN